MIMRKNFLPAISLAAILLTGCVKNDLPEIETGTSPVVINEAYSNGGRSTYGDLDWVELYNTSTKAVDISGFILYDKADKSDMVTIPANTTIAGHAFLRVEVDVDGGFGLGSGGDVVYLENSEGIVDVIEFGALGVNEAWAANPDGSDTFVVQTPTPGVSNNDAVTNPSITGVTHTPASPTSDEDVTVSATVTAGEGTLSSVVLKWKLNGAAQSDITMTASGNTYSVTIPAQVADAQVEYAVTATNSVDGEASIQGNYTVRDAAVVDYTGLVINEIDGNGKFVELYNGGETKISLTGVKLIKNDETDAKDIWWTGGAVTIEAGGFYTIGEEGSETAGLTEATGNGGISPKKNVKFELVTPDNDAIDMFVRAATYELDETVTPDYGKGTQYSFARCPDGTGSFGLAVPSCNAANPFMSAGAIVTEEASSKLTNLVINEVDGNGKFIEIYNTGDASVSLEGVTIYKNLDSEEPWWVGDSKTIPAGGFYTIGEDGSDTPNLSEATGAGGISPKKTVRFDMVTPGNMLLDAFARVKADNLLDESCSPDYGKGTQYSFSRNADGTFGLAVPTCNAANSASAGAIVTE